MPSLNFQLDLDKLQLAEGSHDNGPPPSDPNCQMCLFEAYNLLTVGPVDTTDSGLTDDRPTDVSEVLHAFGIRLNDSLPDHRRQELKRFLPDTSGRSLLSDTAGDGLDETRSYMALDWLIRTYTPAWLDLAGLTAEAQSLRGLRRIVDLVAAQAAGLVVRDARDKARAAVDAARATAVATAVAAARAAAGAALAPTVGELQTSAIALYAAMIRPDTGGE